MVPALLCSVSALQLLPKNRLAIWRLAQLADQIMRWNNTNISGLEKPTHPSVSTFPDPLSVTKQQQQQQQQQESIEVLQQQAAVLLAKPHPEGHTVLTPEFLQNMFGAFEFPSLRSSLM